MTPEERAERAVDNGDCATQIRLSEEDRETWIENVVREIRAAVEEEREEIAQWHDKQGDDPDAIRCLWHRNAAAAIRARGKA